MSCNTRYWHGMSCSTPDKPQNAALAAENNKSLAALRAAREAQDAKWNYAAAAQPSTKETNKTNLYR
jgi:hypothetical protein